MSQLEVDFAVIAACIPTVLRLVEEGWSWFCVRVFRGPVLIPARGGESGSDTVKTDDVHLENLQREIRDQSSGPYIAFDHHSCRSGGGDSEEEILKSSSRDTIKIRQVSVSSSPASKYKSKGSC